MRNRAAVALTATVTAGVLAAHANAAQIEVTAVAQHTNVARLPPKGRGGDATSSRWIIRDRYGANIGDFLTDCRWITLDLRLCVGQLSLPLGAIVVMGASRTPFIGQLAVVGGTGRYAGAQGTLTFNGVGAGRYVLSTQFKQ